MPAILAFIIVAISVIIITYKTYMGYGSYHWGLKLGFFMFITFGWCAPFIAFYISHNYTNTSLMYLTKCLYFVFGFVFFLFAITLIRDTVWVLVDIIRRAPMDNLKEASILQKANIITIIFSLLVSCYAVYEAEKDATIKNYTIASAKVKEPTKIVMLSDLHIDTDVSKKYVKKIVEKVNALNPDAVVLVGDVIDNTPYHLFEQMEELKQLKTKYGVYITLGNHEFYNGPMDWMMKFGGLRFNLLNNYGMRLGDSGIYIAGIPDINAATQSQMKIKFQDSLVKAQENDYVILLSHTPKLAEGVTSKNVDLQLSGHTHGGQIYPFHYFTKQANGGMLAGFYKPEGVNLYVSRGTRYWGPPMRLFAPSEITVFNLEPQK